MIKTTCSGQPWPSPGFSSERTVCCQECLYKACSPVSMLRTLHRGFGVKHGI